MSSVRPVIAALASLALLVVGLSGTARCEPSGKLTIYQAGSLDLTFDALEKRFSALYPKVHLQRESAGSVRLARLISLKNPPADIMVSADSAVIDNFLVPAFTDVNIRFASNQLVLCYTDKSRFASEITPANWYKILTRMGVSWGHADPNLSPCGYRSLMAMQLAEMHYKKPGLYHQLMGHRSPGNIRPTTTDLVSRLKDGRMDYAWEYLSEAVQNGLKYVVLDDHINLGNYAYDEFYRQAVVNVAGRKPGTVYNQVGTSCTYGVSLLKNAPNPEAAEAFLAFLLDPQGGLKIMQDMGQPPFVPARVPTSRMRSKLPGALQALVEVKS